MCDLPYFCFISELVQKNQSDVLLRVFESQRYGSCHVMHVQEHDHRRCLFSHKIQK